MQSQQGLRGALRWPTFLYGVFCLYWGLALAVLRGRINPFRRSGRNDLYAGAKAVMDALRVKVLRADGRGLYRAAGRCMFLCNHRSWADFFIDIVLTEGRAMPLSRVMVAVAFPALILPLVAARAILVFNKSRGVRDTERFNGWVGRQVAASPYNSILVYPEGHRGIRHQSQPLKRGMLHYAFSRQLPVQIVMTANKEAVLSEKEGTARLGQTVVTSFSGLVDPTDCKDFEDFAAKVQKAWEEEWTRVYSADIVGLPEAQPPAYSVTYSLSTLALTGTSLLATTVAFLASLFVALKAATWVGSLLGGLAPMVAAALAAFCTASLREYSKPVDLRVGPVAPSPASSTAGMEGGVAGGAGPLQDAAVGEGTEEKVDAVAIRGGDIAKEE